MQISLLLGTLLVSWLLVRLIRAKLGTILLDRPSDRSSHSSVTPRGGGLGFVAAFVAGALVFRAIASSHAQSVLSASQSAYLAAALILIAVGTWDDWRSLSSAVRLFFHLAAALLVVLALSPSLDFLAFEIPSAAAYVAAVLILVGMLNIYNFMDGLDGIVASCAFFQLVFVWQLTGAFEVLILAAAIFGFLIWNWQPAKIFMGDGASTYLGFTMAFLIIHPGLENQALQIAALTLPLMLDGIYTLFKRLLRAENLFKAHRSHIYQRLHQAGFSHAQVAASYAFTTVCVGLLQVEFRDPLGPPAGFLFSAAALAVFEYLIYARSRSESSR